VSVGRVRGNDLVLSKGNVSKRHARLTQKDGRFVVVDQNSTNGTYVNRQRIVQATIVREGDRIYIGDFVLRIEEAGGVQTNSEENASNRSEGETVEHTSWQGPSPDELKSPQLPPAPRLPAPLSRVPKPAPGSESDIPRVSKTEASVPKDVNPVDAVRVLVDRVTEKVERRSKGYCYRYGAICRPMGIRPVASRSWQAPGRRSGPEHRVSTNGWKRTCASRPARPVSSAPAWSTRPAR